jgi:surface antigen
MSIEEVRALGQDLQSRAGNVDDIMGILERVVMNAAWVGPDARRFKDQWWPEHRARLRKVSEDLRGFGQSALNNASEQEQASGGGRIPSAGPSAPGNPSVVVPGSGEPGATAGSPGAATGSLPGSERSWEEVNRGYIANPPPGYEPGTDNAYQCTSWAQYRWQELAREHGIDLPPMGHGDGWQVAANNGGKIDTPPTLGAIASYGNGQEGSYGHVMIVEQVTVTDGVTSIRVSEMNTGSDGTGWQVANPQEYKDTRIFTQQPDGTWATNGSNKGEITFATFPGSP